MIYRLRYAWTLYRGGVDLRSALAYPLPDAEARDHPVDDALCELSYINDEGDW